MSAEEPVVETNQEEIVPKPDSPTRVKNTSAPVIVLTISVLAWIAALLVAGFLQLQPDNGGGGAIIALPFVLIAYMMTIPGLISLVIILIRRLKNKNTTI